MLSKPDVLLLIIAAFCNLALFVSGLISQSGEVADLDKLDQKFRSTYNGNLATMSAEHLRDAVGLLLRWHAGHISLKWSQADRMHNWGTKIGLSLIVLFFLYAVVRLLMGQISAEVELALSVGIGAVALFVAVLFLMTLPRTVFVVVLRRIAEDAP
jgi:hypothetical protein